MVTNVRVEQFIKDSDILLAGPDNVLDLPLRDWSTSQLAVTNIEGLSPGAANVNSEDYGLIDGASWASSRISTRNIVLTMKLGESPSMEAVRRKVYRHFPLKRKIRLTFTTETLRTTVTPITPESYRRLYIDGFVESCAVDYFGEMEGAQISILCLDPYFKGIDEDVTLNFTTTEGGFKPIICKTASSGDPDPNRDVYYNIMPFQDHDSPVLWTINTPNMSGGLAVMSVLYNDNRQLDATMLSLSSSSSAITSVEINTKTKDIISKKQDSGSLVITDIFGKLVLRYTPTGMYAHDTPNVLYNYQEWTSLSLINDTEFSLIAPSATSASVTLFAEYLGV